jgi:hypothetical protein
MQVSWPGRKALRMSNASDLENSLGLMQPAALIGAWQPQSGGCAYVQVRACSYWQQAHLAWAPCALVAGSRCCGVTCLHAVRLPTLGGRATHVSSPPWVSSPPCHGCCLSLHHVTLFRADA